MSLLFSHLLSLQLLVTGLCCRLFRAGCENVNLDRALGCYHICQLLHPREPAGRVLRAHTILLTVEVLDARPDAQRPRLAIRAGRSVNHSTRDPLQTTILSLAAADGEGSFGGKRDRLLCLYRWR